MAANFFANVHGGFSRSSGYHFANVHGSRTSLYIISIARYVRGFSRASGCHFANVHGGFSRASGCQFANVHGSRTSLYIISIARYVKIGYSYHFANVHGSRTLYYSDGTHCEDLVASILQSFMDADMSI